MRLAAVASETTNADDPGSGDAFRIEVGDVIAILPLAVQSPGSPPILSTSVSGTLASRAANHDHHHWSEPDAVGDMNVSAATRVDANVQVHAA